MNGQTLDSTWQDFIDRFSSGGEGALDIFGFAEALVVALIFGLILKALYMLYFRDNEPQDGSLARSLVLLTPSLASIFWMIQTSVVLSLGLLGSMSFVRFRTPVKRSEDVTFIVLALACAIASATHNFAVGIILVVIFLGYTLVRNYVGEGISKGGRFAVVTFNSRLQVTPNSIRKSLDALSLRCDFVSSRSYDGISSLVFNINKLKEDQHDKVLEKLTGVDKDAHINIFYPNDRLGA